MDKANGDPLQRIAHLEAQIDELQARLAESEEALRAIGTGQVDALIVYGEDDERIYTLQGADYAYRIMVESIHEGAASITSDGRILYCNKRLAEMLELPLEQVLGSSFYSYLPPTQREPFSTLAGIDVDQFSRGEFSLSCGVGGAVPVLISASATTVDGWKGACLVVTDLTDQKQASERERELQLRLSEQREEERSRIARNLHDGPLQDLIGLSFTLQEMTTRDTDPGLMEELQSLRQSVLRLAGNLRGVCNELRPPNVVRFGLTRAIQYHSEDFDAKNPALTLHLDLEEDNHSLPEKISGTLFRIYQECLNNVVRHAQANNVTIRLYTDQGMLRMEVEDDGQGFQHELDMVQLAREGHLGLVGMLERAEAIGGKLRILPGNKKGTLVRVEIPVEKI